MMTVIVSPRLIRPIRRTTPPSQAGHDGIGWKGTIHRLILPQHYIFGNTFPTGDIMAKEVRASHILVDKQTEADKLMDKLKGGANFEDLAKKHSSCPSGKKGGDLGYFTRNKMVKEFETAAFAAKKGDIIGPVKTQFGYHIIKVTDSR